MDQSEIKNWQKIASDLEAAGAIHSGFYLRARAIADGEPDPMPTLSELSQKPSAA